MGTSSLLRYHITVIINDLRKSQRLNGSFLKGELEEKENLQNILFCNRNHGYLAFGRID